MHAIILIKMTTVPYFFDVFW